jgi:SAM-dependent methyltransferase
MEDYDRIWREVYGDIQKYGPVHRHMRRILLKLLAPLKYETVVDVGCGNGNTLLTLTRNKTLKRIVGTDISEEAMKIASERIPAEYRILDIEKGSLGETYDMVSCSLLMEHVHDDDAAVANLSRMCGKYLLLSTIQGDYDRYRAWEEKMGHVRNYRRGELQEKVEKNGLRILKKIEWGFPFYSPIARRLQNLNPDFGTGKYDAKTKLIASVTGLLYYLNSSSRGDILILLAEKS